MAILLNCIYKLLDASIILSKFDLNWIAWLLDEPSKIKSPVLVMFEITTPFWSINIIELDKSVVETNVTLSVK